MIYDDWEGIYEEARGFGFDVRMGVVSCDCEPACLQEHLLGVCDVSIFRGGRDRQRVSRRAGFRDDCQGRGGGFKLDSQAYATSTWTRFASDEVGVRWREGWVV